MAVLASLKAARHKRFNGRILTPCFAYLWIFTCYTHVRYILRFEDGCRIPEDTQMPQQHVRICVLAGFGVDVFMGVDRYESIAICLDLP